MVEQVRTVFEVNARTTEHEVLTSGVRLGSDLAHGFCFDLHDPGMAAACCDEVGAGRVWSAHSVKIPVSLALSRF